MKRRFLKGLILTLATFVLFPSCPLTAQESTDASLIIVGPGDPMYTYWGHIGIAIGDDFYDFGNFSFYSEHFYADFAMGRMLYLGMDTPTDWFLSYSMTEDRDLMMYPLNLGREELARLDAILKDWMLPENREYLYDYFLNNCSTIIRDILNEVTRGALRRESAQWEGTSFRHLARTGAYPSPAGEILLHYLLGPAEDEPINGWKLMFLPQAVADIAQNTEYRGVDGKVRILAGDPVVLKKSTREPVPDEPRLLWPWLLFGGLITSAGYAVAERMNRRKTGGRLIGTMFRTLVILTVGLPGAVLGFLMFFTDHASAYANLNFGPSLPTVLLGLIPLWVAYNREGEKRRRAERRLSWIWTANLLGLAVAVALSLTGLNNQDAGAFWAFFTPVCLMCSLPGFWFRDRIA